MAQAVLGQKIRQAYDRGMTYPRRIAIVLGVATIFVLAGVVLYASQALWASLGPRHDISLNIPLASESSGLPPSGKPTDMPLEVANGYNIALFAINLTGPRVLAFDPAGALVTSIPSLGRVVVLLDQDEDGFAETNKPIIEGLNNPHGLAFSDTFLYVAEEHQVSRYIYSPEAHAVGDQQVLFSLPSGGGHSTRTVVIGPDGKLYTSVGSSCNVCVEEDPHRAAILQSELDGGNLHVWANGLRNTVFFVAPEGADPDSFGFFGTDNGRDWLGDDAPPDELNIITEGQNYGWPYCYGQYVHDDDFDPDHTVDCMDKRLPSLYDIPAHSAALGIRQVPSEGWPIQWQGDFLVAYHGSWNRTEPTGYKVVRISHSETGDFYTQEDFITGWLEESQVYLGPDHALGRPVDLLFGTQDELYISDDKAGVIYVVTPPVIGESTDN